MIVEARILQKIGSSRIRGVATRGRHYTSNKMEREALITLLSPMALKLHHIKESKISHSFKFDSHQVRHVINVSQTGNLQHNKTIESGRINLSSHIALKNTRVG